MLLEITDEDILFLKTTQRLKDVRLIVELMT